MTTLNSTVYGAVACSFKADPATPGFRIQRGFASPGFTRNGVGDYTLQMLADGGLNCQVGGSLTFGLVPGGTISPNPAIINVTPVDSLTFRVRTWGVTGSGLAGVQVVNFVATGGEASQVVNLPVNIAGAYRVFSQLGAVAAPTVVTIPSADNAAGHFEAFFSVALTAADEISFLVVPQAIVEGPVQVAAADLDFWITILDLGNA